MIRKEDFMATFITRLVQLIDLLTLLTIQCQLLEHIIF